MCKLAVCCVTERGIKNYAVLQEGKESVMLWLCGNLVKAVPLIVPVANNS